jgi:hypothetical protein
MPLNEIPKFFHPETRSLIDTALEQAWQELKKDGPANAVLARRKLARTIVALAAVGETDPMKLQRFALDATRGAYRPRRQATAQDGCPSQLRSEEGRG